MLDNDDWDFAPTLPEDHDDGLTLNEGQEVAVESIREWLALPKGKDMWCSLTGAAGTGKCLGLGTPVLLHDGSVKAVEAVKPGDLLMGPDGEPRYVVNTTRGRGPLYRINPVRGLPWVCNDVHVLTLVGTNQHNGVVRDVALNDLLEETRGKRIDRDWKLFKPDGVDFPPRAAPNVDPYFVGLWFGDGTKETNDLGLAGVSISKPDEEVRLVCAAIATVWGLRLTAVDEDRCPRWCLVGVKGTANPLTVALREMLGPELRVPDSIRLGDRATRRMFLAGFIDADGHLSCGGFEIVQKRCDYADAVEFIARSLGIWVTRATKTVNGVTYHRLFLSGNLDQLLILIPRKRPPGRKQIKDPLRTGFTVEAIGEGEYAGFQLDGDGRFLLGDFTVTHNTTVLRRLRKFLPEKTLWAGMTGRAASRMHEVVGVPVLTLHATLYMPPRVDENNGELLFNTLRDPPYGAVLIIDEASMITPDMEQDLRAWTQQYNVRILFVGDGFQLPPVITRDLVAKGISEDYTIFAHTRGPGLTEVMRNGDAVLDAATQLRRTFKLPTTSRGKYAFRVVDDALEAAIVDYLADPEDHGVITWTNRSRMISNQIIRARLGIQGEVPQVGEPIVVCKNGGDVMNGESYTIAQIEPGDPMGPVPTWNIGTTCGKRIFAHGWSWSGDAPFIEDRDEWKRYRAAIEANLRTIQWGGYLGHPVEPVPVTYGHVITAHKAQGCEYRRVTVFMPKIDGTSRHFRKDTQLPAGGKVPFGVRWYYTALSRAKQQATILVGR
ncbi:MAG TPA: AAA family ATPase [Acidimicrobiales bacterium]